MFYCIINRKFKILFKESFRIQIRNFKRSRILNPRGFKSCPSSPYTQLSKYLANLRTYLSSCRPQKARTTACDRIRTRLWTTTPTWTTRCASRGNARSRFATTPAIRTRNRRAARWWVWTAVKLWWIIWLVLEPPYLVSRRSCDGEEANGNQRCNLPQLTVGDIHNKSFRTCSTRFS